MSHTAFTLFMLVLLVVLLAHVFACERDEGAGYTGGARGHHGPAAHHSHASHDITQYIVPTSFER
jgi:hypothetical protein